MSKGNEHVIVRTASWGEPYLVLTDEHRDDDVEYDGDIFTCSGCGAYSGRSGPHITCKYEGEYL